MRSIRRLDREGEQYFLAVPSNTLIRDLDADPPAYSGRGRQPKRPWQRVDKWTASMDEDAWTEIEVRDGEKGPVVVEVVKRRVAARTPRRQEGHEEVLVVIRSCDREDQNVVKVDYYLSNAAPEVPLEEFARVAKAEHRIEQCLQRSKSEAGLDQYEVGNWTGWYHHQTLSLIATWFLVTEARRGGKMDTIDHVTTDSARHRVDPPQFQWNSRRQTVNLGHVPKRGAESFRLYLEQLLSCRLAAVLLATTAEWLGSLPRTIHEPLARLGLVEGRTTRTLAELLNEFLARHADRKPATKVIWGQVCRNLDRSFGRERPLSEIQSSDAEAFRTWLSARVATTTTSKRLPFARQFFAFGVRQGWRDTTPLEVFGIVAATRPHVGGT